MIPPITSAPVLVALTLASIRILYTDLREQRIENTVTLWLTLGVLGYGSVLSLASPELAETFALASISAMCAAAVCLALAMWRVGLGIGDLKLIPALTWICVWLGGGVTAILAFLCCVAMLGFVAVMLRMLRTPSDFAAAPALLGGVWLALTVVWTS